MVKEKWQNCASRVYRLYSKCFWDDWRKGAWRRAQVGAVASCSLRPVVGCMTCTAFHVLLWRWWAHRVWGVLWGDCKEVDGGNTRALQNNNQLDLRYKFFLLSHSKLHSDGGLLVRTNAYDPTWQAEIVDFDWRTSTELQSGFVHSAQSLSSSSHCQRQPEDPIECKYAGQCWQNAGKDANH